MFCLVKPPNSKIEKTAKKSFAWCRLTYKFTAVSRSATLSSASRKLLFPEVVSEFCSPWRVREFWPTARDTFSSNRKRYLSCELRMIMALKWLERTPDCNKVREDVARLIYSSLGYFRHLTVNWEHKASPDCWEVPLLLYSMAHGILIYGCNQKRFQEN